MGPPHSHDRNQPRRIAFAPMGSHAFSRVLTNLSQMNISIIVHVSSLAGIRKKRARQRINTIEEHPPENGRAGDEG